MPNQKQAHIDRALSNISTAYIQGADKFIASKVFPIIPVKRQSDVYYTYDKGDFMRDEAQVRANSTESAGGDYDVKVSAPYYCQVQSFHKDVSPQDKANYDVPLNADIDAMEYVTEKMLIRREMTWASKFFTKGVWTTEVAGVDASPATNQLVKWSKETSTPIEDITNYCIKVASQTGYRPNTLVLSPTVYNALAQHFDIIDRIKYTQKGVITSDLLATLFGVEHIHVAWAVVNSAAKGTKDNIDFIMGNNALLCFVEPKPGLKKPSAGYIFSWSGFDGSGAYGSRIVRLPMDILGLGTERIEGEMAFDAKVIGQDLGVFFADIV